MRINIITDNAKSWIIPFAKKLKEILQKSHDVSHVYNFSEILINGDVLFILGCEQILSAQMLSRHKRNIVIHPSLLPLGRGWSPLAWQILEGKNSIPFSLFEASEKVDSGRIYMIDYLKLDGSELNDEIKVKQGELTIKMATSFIANLGTLQGYEQTGDSSYYPRRQAIHSELNINSSILSQFNLLRIVDNERYPAFFMLNGKRYVIKIYKDAN
jgi:methionyl-tRNA formyltransferase